MAASVGVPASVGVLASVGVPASVGVLASVRGMPASRCGTPVSSVTVPGSEEEPVHAGNTGRTKEEARIVTRGFMTVAFFSDAGRARAVD